MSQIQYWLVLLSIGVLVGVFCGITQIPLPVAMLIAAGAGMLLEVIVRG